MSHLNKWKYNLWVRGGGLCIFQFYLWDVFETA